MRLPRNAHDPIPTGYSRDSIFGIASKLAAAKDFSVGAPCVELWEKLGGKVGRMNGMVDVIVGSLPGGDSDSVIAYGPNDYLALLATSDLPDHPRANFEIAKCLGHTVLHYPLVRDRHGENAGMLVRYYAKTPDETLCAREAIQFAFGLLIPRARLMKEWARTSGDVRQLREIFRAPGDLIKGMHEAFADEDAKAA